MKRFSLFLAMMLAVLLLALPVGSYADNTEVFIPDRLNKVNGVPAIGDIWEDKAIFLSMRSYTDVIEISPDEVEILGRGFDCWFTDFHGNAFVPDRATLNMRSNVYQLNVDADGHALVILDDEDYGVVTFSASKTYDDGTKIALDYIYLGISWGIEAPPSNTNVYQTKPDDYHGFIGHNFEPDQKLGVPGDGRVMCMPTTILYSIPGVDFFRTGMESKESIITYVRNVVSTVCSPENDPDLYYLHYDGFYYTSNVKSVYPEGNYIREVASEWRDNKKTELSGYTISYAPNEKEIYEITYAPDTASILEKHSKKKVESYTEVGSLQPSKKLSDTEFIHHYTKDEVLCGLYYLNNTKIAVSGSGNNLSKWYQVGHGRQVKNIKYPCTYFTSPRVTD